VTENVQPGGHLTAPQRRGLDALTSGGSKAQAAIVAGRTERTVNRWLTDCPAFRAAIDDATTMAIDDASQRMALMLGLSIQRLFEILDNPTTNSAVLLRAIDLQASNYIKLREHGDIEERIKALEEQIHG
jgi:hypothetical protein